MSTLDELFAKISAGRRETVPAGPVEHIIVGLGNPGREYEGTRHNAGRMALEALAQKLGVRVEKLRFKSLCGDAVIAGKRVLLMAPGTYMNLSGQAVQEAAAFHKVPMDRVLVLMDDISLPVMSGVGPKPHPDYDLADWVLGKFSPQDAKTLEGLFSDILPICQLMVEGRADEAMSKYNRTGPTPPQRGEEKTL